MKSMLSRIILTMIIIDNYITEFGEDGITESTDKNKIYHVKRFNDTFSNEAVIGKIGVMDKTWADRLVFSSTCLASIKKSRQEYINMSYSDKSIVKDTRTFHRRIP